MNNLLSVGDKLTCNVTNYISFSYFFTKGMQYEIVSCDIYDSYVNYVIISDGHLAHEFKSIEKLEKLFDVNKLIRKKKLDNLNKL